MASGRVRRSLRPYLRSGSVTLLVAGCSASALAAACSGDPNVQQETIDPTTSVTVGSGGSGGEPNITGAGGNQERKVVKLVFDPPTHNLVLNGIDPQTAVYDLVATFEDGSTESVAAEALQFDRPDLADLVLGPPVKLVADGQYAGQGTVYAVFRGEEATATLNVTVAVEDVGQGIPDDVVTKLKENNLPQDEKLSSLLYPYDKTVFPQGLTSPLIMWSGVDAADVYRVKLKQTNYQYDGFIKPGLPSSARVPQIFWDKMVASNPGGPIDVEVSRYDAATSTAKASAKQTWTIAAASLRGAIYYWSVDAPPGAEQKGALARINPGGKQEVLLDGKCVGCHAVSSDGTTLVGTLQGDFDTSDPGAEFPWAVYNLPDMKPGYQSPANVFGGSIALNKDGKYVVYGDRDLRLAKTADGTVIPNSGIEQQALKPGTPPVDGHKKVYGLMAPVFAPAGDKFAAVDGDGIWYPYLEGGSLLVWDFDEASLTFTNKKDLLSTAKFPEEQRALNYPSFTPDGQWVAVQVSDDPTECQFGDACDNTTTGVSRLVLQSLAGGDPVDLTTLNDGAPNAADHNLAFEPTFMPIERGGFVWVVFTSMRDWGHRLVGQPNNGKKRLWVAALRKDASGGTDPSFPPFYLEGQDDETTNLRGFWALSQCIESNGGGTCTAGFECCDGFCDKGKCVTPQQFSCVGIGGACTTKADCCNDKVVSCIDGVCALGSPK